MLSGKLRPFCLGFNVLTSGKWNLYEVSTKSCGLSRQVVFHHRDSQHDFVKIVSGKLQDVCVFIKTSLVSLNMPHCALNLLPEQFPVTNDNLYYN